ncbi:MAG: hypothetical protein LAT82_04465, partial [Nanoarchaeota archaeon]|nr:hypothetical protein [Nanoarchaeota archaeon]
ASNYATKRIACAGKGIVASISSGPGAAIVGTLSTIGCVGSAAIGLFGLYSTVSQINLLQADIPLIMSIFKFPGIETELTPQQEISLQLISNWLNDIDSFNYEDLNQISPFILNNLEGDPRRTYDRINRGDTNINQNSLQELVSQIALRQVSIITNTQDSFDFEQYVEIMPQSDFYRECGVVTNTNLRR